MQLIQLELWPLLEEAEHDPSQAQLDQIWSSWEQLELQLDQQLALGGELILRLATVVQARSASLLQGVVESNQEPVVEPDLLFPFVRQSLVVDLAPFIEAPEIPERTPVEGTQVRVISKEELYNSNLISEEPVVEELAHEEDISAWVGQIQQYLAHHPQGLWLLDLHQGIELPLISVWMAVLLGGLGIYQTGEFYQPETIWVDQAASASTCRMGSGPLC